ncbi:MAG TPA: DUF411 domain-containing protein [Herminiimonas sp.]|nr:DUF411 domain-containing protein [Herminiimonas sp.]
MHRRSVLQAFSLLAWSAPLALSAKNALPVIEVYKSATCGCCTQWVEHLQKNGFKVNARNVPNTAAYRAQFGVPSSLGSCHTASIGGYAIEGHVPAADIKRLLAERPKAAGLAVPEMPMGSPGMEGAYADAFDVLLFQADGSRTVYRHYAAK